MYGQVIPPFILTAPGAMPVAAWVGCMCVHVCMCVYVSVCMDAWVVHGCMVHGCMGADQHTHRPGCRIVDSNSHTSISRLNHSLHFIPIMLPLVSLPWLQDGDGRDLLVEQTMRRSGQWRIHP